MLHKNVGFFAKIYKNVTRIVPNVTKFLRNGLLLLRSYTRLPCTPKK